MTPQKRSTQDTQDLVVRLRRIEGQVRGIQRMVENGRPPVDALTQLASIHGGLAAVGSAILAAELARLAPDASDEDVANFHRTVCLLADR